MEITGPHQLYDFRRLRGAELDVAIANLLYHFDGLLSLERFADLKEQKSQTEEEKTKKCNIGFWRRLRNLWEFRSDNSPLADWIPPYLFFYDEVHLLPFSITVILSKGQTDRVQELSQAGQKLKRVKLIVTVEEPDDSETNRKAMPESEKKG